MYLPMTVCFIGHRKIENAKAVEQDVYATLRTLILQGADTFIFGSKSEFDSLCWRVVTALQEEFPHIRRISFTTPSETSFTSKQEREQCEQFFLTTFNKQIHFADYEQAYPSPSAVSATKDVYVMRNQDMIDSSDVCIFYYNQSYTPPKNNQADTKQIVPNKSGTALAYTYAKRRGMAIINICK